MDRDDVWGAEIPEKPGADGAPPALPPLCRKCRRVIDRTHKFCPHCGQRQDAVSAWYYHPVWILVLAITALGPLVLPLVWRSQQMGRTGKVVMTAAILIYSAFAIYLSWQMGRMYWTYFSDLNNMMREIHPH